MKKLFVLAVLASPLFLSACVTPPPPVVIERPVHHVYHHRDDDQVNVSPAADSNSAEGFRAVERPSSYSN